MAATDMLHFSSQTHAFNLLKHLNKLRCKTSYCDVEISVQNKVIFAHRNILAACSPYFDAMFSDGLVESETRKVELYDVDPVIFNNLVDFIYTGELEVNTETCQDLLSIADMYEVHEARQACCEFLEQQLHPSNCIGIFAFADAHNCLDLKATCERYIHRHFTETVIEFEFLQLPKDMFVKILKSEDLHIDSEFQVFTAALSWVLHDLPSRRKHIFEVLAPVRLPIIPKSQLENYVNCLEDTGLKVAIRKLMKDMKDAKYTLPPKPGILKPFFNKQMRKCAKRSLYFIGGYHRHEGGRWCDAVTLNTTEVFDTFYEIWRALPSLKQARSSHGVASLDGLIYVVGGESDSLIYDTVECFDPVCKKWSMVASMTVPRCALGVCAVDDSIYAFGGWVGSEIGKTIEKYCPQLKCWKEVGRLDTLRYAMGAVEYKGLIYVLGGMSDLGNELKKVESYDPVSKEWHRLSDMRVPRAYVGVAVLDGHIYAVGGLNEHQGSLNVVEQFDPETNRFKDMPPMSVPRAGASVAAINGKLYVIGGRTTSKEYAAPCTLELMECFNPRTMSWSICGNVLTSRCDGGVVVL